MKTSALSLLILLTMTGCDAAGGGAGGAPGDDTGGSPDVAGSTAVQCTKTATCPWGEACVNHACAVPAGAPPAPAFDFAAVDQCPGSGTFEEEVRLSDLHGRVVMLYFATTGCAACVADVKVYETLVEQMEAKGFGDLVTLITVILPYGAATLAEFTEGLSFPVVVDTDALGIAAAFGASKDTVVLIDHAGYLAEDWPGLEVRGAAGDKPLLQQKLGELANAAL